MCFTNSLKIYQAEVSAADLKQGIKTDPKVQPYNDPPWPSDDKDDDNDNIILKPASSSNKHGDSNNSPILTFPGISQLSNFSFSFFCDFGAGEYFKSNFSLYMKEWNCFCKVGSSCGKQQRPPKQKSKLITFVLSVIYQMLSSWQAFTDNFQKIFVSTFC